MISTDQVAKERGRDKLAADLGRPAGTAMVAGLFPVQSLTIWTDHIHRWTARPVLIYNEAHEAAASLPPAHYSDERCPDTDQRRW